MGLPKKVIKDLEALEATGAEGKYGEDQAKSYFKDQEKQGQEEYSRQLEMLAGLRQKTDYIQFLSTKLVERLKMIPWYPGWDFKVAGTNEGVVMEIKTHTGRMFRSAFKVVFDPYYDLNAINNFGERAELLLDKLTQIKIPDQNILKA